MEAAVKFVLLGFSAILFLVACVLVFWFIRKVDHRRAWFLIGAALLVLALMAGVIIYQALMPDQIYTDLLIGVLMVTAASLACWGLYLFRNQIISEKSAKTTTQESLERFRLSFEKTPHLQLIKDIEGTYLAANSEYGKLLGKSSQALVGESDFNFLPRSQAMSFRQEEERVIKSGKQHSKEEKIRGIDGIRWFWLTRIPLKDNFDTIFGVLSSGYDITAQKEMEAALGEWKRGLDILHEAENAIEKQNNSETLLASILRWAGRLGEGADVGLWLIIPEKSTAVFKAGSGKLEPFVGRHLKPGKDIAWKVWESGQPVIVSDYQNWPDRGQWAPIPGLESGIGIPMKVNDVTTSVLVIFHDQPERSYADERVAVLEIFARSASSRLNYINNLESIKRELGERQVIFSNLEYQAGLDHVFAMIATRFISLDAQKIDEAIQQALVMIGERSGVRECYLRLFPKNVYSKMQQPLVYSSVSRTPSVSEYDFTREDFGWCLERLNQFQVVNIPSLIKLAPDNPTVKAFLESKSLQSFTAVPLISNRLVIGFFGFEAQENEMEWSTDILSRLRVAADMFVNVLARKWAAHDISITQEQTRRDVKVLEQRSHESGLIAEMGDLLQACRTSDEAYPIITRYVQNLIPMGSGALYMIQHTQDPAERVATWGDEAPSPLEHELQPNECWALRRGRIYVVKDPANDPTCGHVKDADMVGYMCVPLIAQGVAIGVLHLRINRADVEFPPEKQQLAVKISEFTSMALTNLKLRDELRAQAIRDPLTGLFNRRYMEETLEREVRRAQRHGTSVGVIMFDIDKLKPINDQLGHDAGDLVLRTLGEELLRLFRSEDVACRYGGDEFTIVLPEASLAAAWQRAEELRDTLKGQNLQYEGKRLEPITLSIGVAAFPDHGATAESLLLASDAGSYAAKSEGGDRIMVGHKDET